MAKMIPPTRSRRLWLALPALALTAAAVLSTPAQATNPNGCQGPGTNTTYYSNASLTNAVGQYNESCAGVCSGSGRVSQHFVVFNTGCAPIDPEP